MDKDKSTYIISSFRDLLGITPNEQQVEQLLTFYEMTIEKNKVMNLTAITDFKEFVIKHFVDSISIVKILDLKNKKQKVIDIILHEQKKRYFVFLIFKNNEYAMNTNY